MTFQIILAISEFKNNKPEYYHSRVISITKGVDKYQLSKWDPINDPLFPNDPGIWKLTLEQVPSTQNFKIMQSKMVYNIKLS